MRVVATAAALALLAIGTVVAEAPVYLQAHRLLQYDSVVFGRPAAEASKLGSRKAALRGAITTSSNGRGPMVVDAAAVTSDGVSALLESSQSSGLVVLLPEAGLSGAAAAGFRALEAEALTREAGAVYAIPFSGNVSSFKDLVGTSTSVEALAAAEAPVARTASTSSKVTVHIAEAVKPASAKGPLVALVAGYDSLGAFPTLPQPGSSADAAALLELAHLFGGQKAEGSSSPGIVVVLASGSRQSYHGLKQWLADSSSIADRLESVICVERLTDAKQLAMHTARDAAKDEQLKALEAALKVDSVPKRVDPSSNELRWPHEVFAHKGLSAATLTSSEARRQALRSSSVDTPSSATDIAAVVDRIAAAVTTVTGAKAKGSADVARIQRTLRSIGDAARPSFDMPAAAVNAVHSSLSAAVQPPKPAKAIKARRLEYNFAPPEAVFYTSQQTTIGFYASKPLAFELMNTAVIVGALVAATMSLLGPGALAEIFSGGKKK